MSAGLRARVHAATAAPVPAETGRPRRPVRFRRVILTAAAVLCCAAFGLGVAAGAFPGFERFIARMGEDVRHLLQPVMLQDTEQDIEMEVLAAAHDGEMAAVYLSFTDLAGSRITENTEIGHLEVPGTHMSWGHQVDFDPETQSAIFRLEFDGKEMLGGKKMTLEVTSLLTGGQYHEGLSTGLSLADIKTRWPAPAVAGTNLLDEDGFATGGFGMQYGPDAAVAEQLRETFDAGELPLLAPMEAPVSAGEDAWVEIEAVGVVDGFLHVRYRPLTEAARFSYTEFSLSWPGADSGDYLSALTFATLGLGEPEEVDNHILYEAYEQVLELPKDVEPADVQLQLCGTSYEERIEGNWSVTFTLNENPPLLEANCDVDLNGWRVTRVVVSSIGAIVYGEGETNEFSLGADVEVWLKDGTLVESDSHYSFSDVQNERITSRSGFTRPIDPADVDRVLLNGKELPFAFAEA